MRTTRAHSQHQKFQADSCMGPRNYWVNGDSARTRTQSVRPHSQLRLNAFKTKLFIFLWRKAKCRRLSVSFSCASSESIATPYYYYYYYYDCSSCAHYSDSCCFLYTFSKNGEIRMQMSREYCVKHVRCRLLFHPCPNIQHFQSHHHIWRFLEDRRGFNATV